MKRVQAGDPKAGQDYVACVMSMRSGGNPSGSASASPAAPVCYDIRGVSSSGEQIIISIKSNGSLKPAVSTVGARVEAASIESMEVTYNGKRYKNTSPSQLSIIHLAKETGLTTTGMSAADEATWSVALQGAGNLISSSSLPVIFPEASKWVSGNDIIFTQSGKEEKHFSATSILRCGECGSYGQMLAESQEFKKIALRMERDDAYYQEVILDIRLNGYDSLFAVLGMAVSEDSFEGILNSDFAIDANKSVIIERIKDKAAYRERIARAGITGDSGEKSVFDPYTGKPIKVGGIPAEVLTYFCNRDKDKITSTVWDALYQAGDIDHDAYTEEWWKSFVDTSFETALTTLIVEASGNLLAPFLFERFSLLSASGRRLLLGTGAARRLQALMLDESGAIALGGVTPLARTVATLRAEEVNALRPLDYPSWLLGTRVRIFELSKPRRFVRFFNDTVTKGDVTGSWMTLGLKHDIERLTAAEIKDKFALEFLPTHWVEVTAPKGVEISVGWANPVKEWGVKGGGRQIFVSAKDFSKLTFISKKNPILR